MNKSMTSLYVYRFHNYRINKFNNSPTSRSAILFSVLLLYIGLLCHHLYPILTGIYS